MSLPFNKKSIPSCQISLTTPLTLVWHSSSCLIISWSLRSSSCFVAFSVYAALYCRSVLYWYFFFAAIVSQQAAIFCFNVHFRLFRQYWFPTLNFRLAEALEAGKSYPQIDILQSTPIIRIFKAGRPSPDQYSSVVYHDVRRMKTTELYFRKQLQTNGH